MTTQRVDPPSDGHDDAITTRGNRQGRRLPDLTVNGITETEIFALAPVMRCDRVYWTTDAALDVAELLAELPYTAWTRRWSDGTHRVWVPEGHGDSARDDIRERCVTRGIEPVNLRVEKGVPFRDVSLIPDALLADLVATCVDWLIPHTTSIQRRLVAEIPGVDEDDVRGMMYLFVHDHLDRFDSGRQGRNGSLNFTAFILGKMRNWPQDLARATFGRTTVNDRVALQQVRDEFASTLGRAPTEWERAEALGLSVTDLRAREEAVSGLLSLRYADPILAGADGVDVVDEDADVTHAAMDQSMRAALTSAIMAAVFDPDGSGRRSVDPLGLAVVYLMFWEGLTRTEIAEQLGVLPKTVTAALNRTMRDIDAEAFAS
jgi:DNA-directed RNA polymerase specialized sigma subunit